MDVDPIENNPHKTTGAQRVLRAFWYSIEGLRSSFKHDPAFRQESVLACILIPASFLLGVPLSHHLVLVVSVVLVLIVELLNSSIEAVVDDISLRNRPLAKRAKDMGSAAVFLSLWSVLVCWVSVIVVNWDRITG